MIKNKITGYLGFVVRFISLKIIFRKKKTYISMVVFVNYCIVQKLQSLILLLLIYDNELLITNYLVFIRGLFNVQIGKSQEIVFLDKENKI